MAEIKAISTVGIVLFIAAGLLLFILVAVLAKRQIMRFNFRSSHRPHISIGADATKILRKEIQKHLGNVCKIKYEPVLLSPRIQEKATSVNNHYYYRMKAMDAFSKFDEVLKLEEPELPGRHPNSTVRQYLHSLYPDYLSTSSTELIQQFSDSYEHARHDPKEFGESEYNQYMGLLDELLTCISVGVKKKSGVILDKSSPHLETKVVYKTGKGQTKTVMCDQHSHPVTEKQTEIRQRTSPRDGSSVVSSFPDSGHSSHQSTASVESFGPRAQSPERIVLLELDNRDFKKALAKACAFLKSEN